MEQGEEGEEGEGVLTRRDVVTRQKKRKPQRGAQRRSVPLPIGPPTHPPTHHPPPPPPPSSILSVF